MVLVANMKFENYLCRQFLFVYYAFNDLQLSIFIRYGVFLAVKIVVLMSELSAQCVQIVNNEQK